jgi:hypothetical protein
MRSASPAFAQLKSNMKPSWTAGDFGQIANYTVKAGEEFVAPTEIAPAVAFWMLRAARETRRSRRPGRAL